MKPTPLAILFVLMFGALIVIQNIDASSSPGETMEGKGEVEMVAHDPLQVTSIQVEESPAFHRISRR